MSRTATRQGSWLLLLAPRLAVLLTLLPTVAFGSCAAHDPRAEVVDPAVGSTTGWQTIRYEGIRIEIPAGWTRSDMGGGEFGLERWGPADAPRCGRAGGVSIYRSATFDPAYGPGVRRAGTGAGAPSWGGYTLTGDFDVYAADDRREVVARILASAR